MEAEKVSEKYSIYVGFGLLKMVYCGNFPSISFRLYFLEIAETKSQGDSFYFKMRLSLDNRALSSKI